MGVETSQGGEERDPNDNSTGSQPGESCTEYDGMTEAELETILYSTPGVSGTKIMAATAALTRMRMARGAIQTDDEHEREDVVCFHEDGSLSSVLK